MITRAASAWYNYEGAIRSVDTCTEERWRAAWRSQSRHWFNEWMKRVGFDLDDALLRNVHDPLDHGAKSKANQLRKARH